MRGFGARGKAPRAGQGSRMGPICSSFRAEIGSARSGIGRKNQGFVGGGFFSAGLCIGPQPFMREPWR
jgi:hypothetical protein